MKNFEKFLKGEITYDVKSKDDFILIVETVKKRLGDKLINRLGWIDLSCKYVEDSTYLKMYNNALYYTNTRDNYDLNIIPFTRLLKDQVTTSTVVKLRNGEIRFVVLHNNKLALLNSKDHISLDFYTDDLLHTLSSKYDVVAMEHFDCQAYAIYNALQDDFQPEWTWEREELTNYESICKDKRKLLDVFSDLVELVCMHFPDCSECPLLACCTEDTFNDYLESPFIPFAEYACNMKSDNDEGEE